MQGSSLKKMGSWVFGSSQRHNLTHKEKPVKININEVVIIEGDEKNYGKWKIGIIENIFMSNDNRIRSVRIRTEKNFIERPIPMSYLMN